MKRAIVLVALVVSAAIAGCIRTVVLDPQPDAAGVDDGPSPDGAFPDGVPGDAAPVDGSSPDVPHD